MGLQSRRQGLPMRLSGCHAQVLQAQGQWLSDRGLHTLMRLDVMRISESGGAVVENALVAWHNVLAPARHDIFLSCLLLLSTGCHVFAGATFLDLLWCMHRWQEHAVLA